MIKNVLIVDSSQLFREGLSKILLDSGLSARNIAIVESGVDGLDYIEEYDADLIIFHTNVSDITLTDFHAALKNISSCHQSNVLAINDIAPHTDSNAIVKQPKLCHIVKPFNSLELRKKLLELTNDPIFKEQETQITSPQKKLEPSKAQSKPNILIVDDESMNIEVASAQLSPLYRVMAVKNGEQAIKVIKKNCDSLSLILLDIMMPEMDGYEVCQQLKASPTTADIPVIFLTAKTEISDITKGFSVGAVDYITKPLQGDILLARVATHVKLQESKKLLANQIKTLEENARLRADIERITQHDLKGPLSSILFETYQLKDKKAANSIATAVNNVVSMINHSLDVFKIEQGNYVLKPSIVDMSNFVNDAINAFTDSAHQKNVTIKTSGLEYEHKMLAEPLLCLSIFNNLVKNAVEAAPSGSEISISLLSRKTTEVFKIKNQGTIPLDLREYLFEKYTSSNKSKGSGIGTYSAKLMTEVQNGSISFNIIDEFHTEFIVIMPKTSDR